MRQDILDRPIADHALAIKRRLVQAIDRGQQLSRGLAKLASASLSVVIACSSLPGERLADVLHGGYYNRLRHITIDALAGGGVAQRLN